LCKNKEVSELGVKIEYSKKENNELKQQIKEFEGLFFIFIFYKKKKNLIYQKKKF